jgi:tetratricopeptide (TPR) repeat protein
MCVAIKKLFVKNLLTRSVGMFSFCAALLGAGPVVFASTAATQIEAALPPLVLMSPLSQISLDALTGEADAAYAAKNLKIAQDLLQSVLDLAPGNRRALFRLANIHQQRGQLEKALHAYRQTAEPNEFSEGLDEFAEKALINIALIGADQSRSALAELEKRQPDVKNQVVVKRMFDDLSDTDALLAARIARLSKVVKSSPNSSSATQQPVLPQIIQGRPVAEFTGPAQVVYESPQAVKASAVKRQSAVATSEKKSR